MNAQRQLLGLGSSVLAVAGMINRLKSKFNSKGINQAKKNYNINVNIKKDNNSIAKKQVEEQAQPQKFILSEEGATYPISADNTKTNIKVDDEVKGLIKLRQKNAKRAMAGRLSANEYKNEIAKAKDLVGGKKEDVWNEIGLDVDITDDDIKKAGYTKTDIIRDFNEYANRTSDWAISYNKKAVEKDVDYAVSSELNDYVAAQQDRVFGKAWSALILDKKRKAEFKEQEEKYYEDLLKKQENEEVDPSNFDRTKFNFLGDSALEITEPEENYRVWDRQNFKF